MCSFITVLKCYVVNETALKRRALCRFWYQPDNTKIEYYQLISTYLETPAKSLSARSSCQFAINVPLAAFMCLLYAVSVILLNYLNFDSN